MVKPKTRKKREIYRRFIREPFNKTRPSKEFLLNREIEHINRHGFSVFELILFEFCIMFLSTNSCKEKAEKVTTIFHCCVDLYNHNTKKNLLQKRPIAEIKEAKNKR